MSAFSLPTQRCFLCAPDVSQAHPLFSAYAEVFPLGDVYKGVALSFLCLRRGVSISTHLGGGKRTFSLPTQRCFCVVGLDLATRKLFSAYAEVFPLKTAVKRMRPSFLCLRRGVSGEPGRWAWSACFSLPTQRCFQAEEMEKAAPELFSAYAEVFPRFPFWSHSPSAFLCLRRGVSRLSPFSRRLTTFSLPTQRCFLAVEQILGRVVLFSAYAEVFPPRDFMLKGS